ncbi:MAG TPA: TetR/AcrR family transcriptional regulator [Reyranella sp.]|jgi:AcrR family transcriptional regulator|nr:TetR/AcrR family transcriptional regulator [Reyranella sp.]
MKQSTKPEQLAPVDSADAQRQRVLGAAFAAFLEKGYARTSMLDIASRAKISKRDLYAMCSGKPEMLREVIAERARRMRLALDLPAATDRAGLAATLKAFGLAVLKGVCSRPVLVLHRMAIAVAEDAPEVARTLDEAGRKVNRGALRRFLAQAQLAKLLKPGGDPTTMMDDFFALLWGGLLIELLMGVKPTPSSQSLNARAERATSKFLDIYGA